MRIRGLVASFILPVLVCGCVHGVRLSGGGDGSAGIDDGSAEYSSNSASVEEEPPVPGSAEPAGGGGYASPAPSSPNPTWSGSGPSGSRPGIYYVDPPRGTGRPNLSPTSGVQPTSATEFQYASAHRPGRSPASVANDGGSDGEQTISLTPVAQPTRPAVSAAVSVPPEMFRGSKARVRLVIRADGDQRATNIGVETPGNITMSVEAAHHANSMEASLTGEGFKIEAKTPVMVDSVGGVSNWEWEVEPTRGNKHYLRIEAWTLVKQPDGSKVRDKPVFVPPVTVAVPVRWWPDQVNDFLDDSEAWFKRGENWLVTLTAFLGALLALWVALRKFGKAGDKAKPA